MALEKNKTPLKRHRLKNCLENKKVRDVINME